MDAAKLLEMVKSKQKAMVKRDRTVKCIDGKNRIRVLPGWRKAEPERFWQDFGQHFIKGEDGEIKAVHVCAEKTFGKPCNVCSSLQKALKSTRDDDLVKVLSEAKASERILVNALMLDSSDPTTPQILELPPTVFKGILSLFEEWGNVVDPSEGRDVIVTREGKGIGTKYAVSPAGKATVVPPAAQTKLHDLDAYVDQESAENESKAILAIAAVAGLAAGTTSVAPAALPPGDKPATPVAGLLASDTTVVATKAPASEVALDEELEALLTAGA